MTERISTREAFKPNSGVFGSMLGPVAKIVQTQPAIEVTNNGRQCYLDTETSEWVVVFPCGTVARSTDKQSIEDLLDLLDRLDQEATQ